MSRFHAFQRLTAPFFHSATMTGDSLLGNKRFMMGSLIVSIIIFVCVFAPFLTTHKPNDIDMLNIEAAPSIQHWLGTDTLGRDVFSRLLYGGRVSILVGLAAVGLQIFIGVILGVIAGYGSPCIDSIIMRISEVFQCFPFYPTAITMAAVFGASIWNVVVIIGLLQWPGIARLIRSEVLSLKERSYIEYSQAIGVSKIRIILDGLLRNCVPVIVVNASLAVTGAILAEAALSFLGLGVTQPNSSWGNMLSAAQNFRILSYEPWMWVPPGLAIVLLVLSVNIIGEALQDHMRPRFSYIRDINFK